MKFRNYVNEDISNINDSNIGNIITYSLYMVAQTHLWHLKTTKAQEHIVLGEFYEILQNDVDELAERFIAQGGIINSLNIELNVDYILQNTIEILGQFRDNITSAISSNPEMASLVDALTDIQEHIDRTLFKLNLQ